MSSISIILMYIIVSCPGVNIFLRQFRHINISLIFWVIDDIASLRQSEYQQLIDLNSAV
jgi:hypothetical protein